MSKDTQQAALGIGVRLLPCALRGDAFGRGESAKSLKMEWTGRLGLTHAHY